MNFKEKYVALMAQVQLNNINTPHNIDLNEIIRRINIDAVRLKGIHLYHIKFGDEAHRVGEKDTKLIKYASGRTYGQADYSTKERYNLLAERIRGLLEERRI
ncbi:1034_t:CDS:1 [Entrophospora sp. SA101]|nr:6990_t:CDS:1 [Entrophospora sp. SA101]CAJ0627470.1 12923_t:CDS:1 [Entrophospora sp. SA101]CAJ0746275.1 22454_t:CDS:1 [Entrophospora sp. SA101]CAJ0753988.1 8266_t:CDS:1 [Entrophospora sp. SA101]CAJ0759086.1 1034_t:CDS:1 [Entrophospora sp. SA101]